VKPAMDFNQNLKAFLKHLPLNKMSGHQKFAAVAAIQCKGDTKVEVSTQDIQKQWRTTVLRVKYNPSLYDRAQGAGWVDPTEAKGRFRVTQAGLENLEALVPEFTAGELKKSGSLTIFGRKATHTFDKFLRTTLAAAKNQVLIADSWVDGTIFDTVLDVIPKDCTFKLIYAQARGNFDARAKRFSQQYGKFLHKRYKNLHDRFMVVDETAYILGPSIKDAASNSPALVVTLGSKEKNSLQSFFTELWSKAK
jgi:hypothetical protein